MLLDLHTHMPAPRPEGIISCNPEELPSCDEFPCQLYSVGLHPRKVGFSGVTAKELASLSKAASREDVVAIGETGIDKVYPGGAPLFAQMNAFKNHIELSESVGKPLIIHCVKAHDIIIQMRKELKPCQRWIIHGFRGKPSILRMLLDAGIDVSYGEFFNPESVAMTPPEHLFAETDESSLPIEEIINRLGGVNHLINIKQIASNLSSLGIYSTFASES